MIYVASKKIVHGDLGCCNVLVYKIDSSGPKNTLVKITDFGLARRLDYPSSTNENLSIIPIRYCAPEILEDNNQSNYSEKSDVFSMSALMWEALSNGEMLYSSIASDDIIFHYRFQLSTEILVEIFLQIIEAMIYIIEQNLVHGDLQCSNVLVFQINQSNSKETLVKLKNFSSAHRNDPSLVKDRRSGIPVRHCALEILRSAGLSNYSELSDVYSMGVLMWEACSNGKVPYSSSTLNSEVQQRKLNGEKLIEPWLCDRQIWSIMEDCWHNEPQLRYNFQEMKIRLSKIDLESEKTYQYEMNVDVQMDNQLYGQFYEAEWI